MDRNSIRLMEDIVLKAREDTNKLNTSKSKQLLPKERPKRESTCFKVNSQNIIISEDSEKQLLCAIKDIYGTAFKLADLCKYKNNSNLGKQYWLERYKLTIKDVSNNLSTRLKNEDETQVFDKSKLENYNFHASHCSEALIHTKGHTNKALELLFYTYYGIGNSPKIETVNDTDPSNVWEKIKKEKEKLQTLYGDSFKEDITNRCWSFNAKLDYLVKNDETENIEKEWELVDGHLATDDSFFNLEIRFPEDCKYPYESPYFYFYKKDGTYPALNCLRIARRLHSEALKFCDKGEPFILSIIDLLHNEREINSYLNENKETFLNRDHSLFFDLSDVKKELPTIVENDSQNKSKTTEQGMTFVYPEILIDKTHLRVRFSLSQILQMIHENQVTILFGNIGCGKTTQVPQYILDEWLKTESEERNEKFGIIVTQPRQLTAIGVAERVAEERLERVGNSVGYQIEFKNVTSSQTRLTFCTEKILLERLCSDPLLDTVTHVIVDQIHERTAECDFILLCLKKLISIRKDLKIILMSSLKNVDIFSNYFAKAPVLDVAPYNYYTFSSTQMFLEQTMESTNYVLDEDNKYTRKTREKWERINKEFVNADLKRINTLHVKDTIPDEDLTLPQVMKRYSGYTQNTQRNIYAMDHDKINYDLIEKVIEWFIAEKHKYYCPINGALLIFLPGIEEITELKNILEKNETLADNPKKYIILAVHANSSIEEQKLIFKKQRSRAFRIILTTDIAEHTIGIDDMYLKVIDTGRIKERRFNKSLDMESLDTRWISKENFQRRISRASFTYSSFYVHLYSSFRFNHNLADKLSSEISRISLEPLLLRLKMIRKNKHFDFYRILGEMIEPPPRDNIESAINRLKYVGALDSEYMLTSLGYCLANLPVDVRIGKLIIYGAIFSCLDSALTLAACFLHENIFSESADKMQELKVIKKEYATENSDQLTILRIYKKWQEITAGSYEAGKIFATENFLCSNTLQVIADTKHYLLELLISTGFVSDANKRTRSMGEDLTLKCTASKLNVNNENYKLLKCLICAVLYPNVAIRTTEFSGTDSQLSSDNLVFVTKDNETVHVYPTSVVNEHNCTSQFLVYRRKVKKQKNFVKEVSEVSTLSLILFCGYGIDIELNDDNCTVSLGDGNITFAVKSLEVAQLLQFARMELAKLIEQKFENPLLDLVNYSRGRKVIDTIVSIVTNN